MKQKKKLTRKEKQAKFKTIATWIRNKEENNRKQAARDLDSEFNP